MTLPPTRTEPKIALIVDLYQKADPDGSRTAGVIRHTFDQIYDGRHTGRFQLEQLSKTEKTHIGSLIEVNLRREFDDLFSDGDKLDFSVEGIEIDCKYSIKFGGWMVPREAVGELLLVVTANDRNSEWGVGVVRASESLFRPSRNQDSKREFAAASVRNVEWIFFGEELPENVLLHLDPEDAERILTPSWSGQRRVNELLRTVTEKVIPRGTIATVAQQDDYMKRIRAHGGATSQLAPEGILVIGGTYESHRMVASELGAPIPNRGETVSVRVVPASHGDLNTVLLEDRLWRLALPDEKCVVPAPVMPGIAKARRRDSVS